MGTNFRWLALPIVLLICSPAAWCAIITDAPYAGSDAGSVDSLIGYGRTSSDDLSTELGFLNYFAGTNYSVASSEKICNSSAECDAIIFGTDSVGAYAIGLPDDPAYYLVKTGAGSGLSRSASPYGCNGSDQSGGNDCDHFVFQNLASLDWGVFNFASMGFSGSIKSIQKIGHIDQFGGDPTSVPEPGTISLLGGGLLGFAMLRRRSLA
jgi:hypothetical protein